MEESFNTTFAIEYWTDGKKDEEAEIFDELEEHEDKVESELTNTGSSKHAILIAQIVGFIVVIIVCFSVGKICRKKRTQIGNQSTSY